jgi:peptidoglycan/LPS O-acetylase OafA/YrhL
VQAEGHLWPMTQIFAFYMLLPLVLMITSVLMRAHVVLPILALCAGAVFWWTSMTDWKPFFNGEYFHEFYLYAFLLGVAASYLQYGVIAKSTHSSEFFTRWRWPFALLGVITLVLTIAWSAPVTPPALVQPYISQFYMKSILSVLIILIALNIRGTFFNKLIANAFFRSVGIVGFSFYILHGLGMQIVQETQKQLLGIPNPADRSWEFVIAAFVVTYLMSLITYSYVERPFFGFRRSPKS